VDGGKILLLVIIATLSLVLAVGAYSVAEHYSLTTPGTFIADHFVPRPVAPQGWGPGNGIFVEFSLDFVWGLAHLCATTEEAAPPFVVFERWAPPASTSRSFLPTTAWNQHES
jgi:hypothetical protein